MHKTLKRWTVKRSGGAMTVYGIDTTTKLDTKITNVVTITAGTAAEDRCVATTRGGAKHFLAMHSS